MRDRDSAERSEVESGSSTAAAGVPPRVVMTEAAADLIRRLRAKHGPLMFHQSGGCCDGSSPMCYPAGEFLVGDRDVLLGLLLPEEDGSAQSGAPVWISGSQFDAWKHTQLVLDVVPGRGGGFSMEAPEGVRFLTRGRVFTAAEQAALTANPPVVGAQYAAGAVPPVPDGPLVVGAEELAEICAVPGVQ